MDCHGRRESGTKRSFVVVVGVVSFVSAVPYARGKGGLRREEGCMHCMVSCVCPSALATRRIYPTLFHIGSCVRLSSWSAGQSQ